MSTPNTPDSNPYRPPQSHSSPKAAGATAGQYAVCPRCGGNQAKRVSWTFWGGALGPSMLTHVRCLACGAKYNGKTGNYNTTGIAIYTAVSLILGLVLAFFLFRFI
jgi:uncharacterized protein (DUF983 family)